MNKVNHEGVGERALYSREYKYRLMRYSGTTQLDQYMEDGMYWEEDFLNKQQTERLTVTFTGDTRMLD